jgi:DNA ligase-1
METYLTILLFFLASLWPIYAVSNQTIAPPLMLAQQYIQGIDVNKYFVSEKLDGVRAYWDGQQLRTRSGQKIAAPVWFLAALPKDRLDGELWLGRGRFDEISGLVRRKKPKDADWANVRYMVYDLPDMVAPFYERLWVLRTLVAEQRKPWLKAVDQRKLNSEQELKDRLAQVVVGGGEGLMLRHSRAYYQVNRSNDLLKLKPLYDAEATVLAHIPGEGKYQGMMGSLLVRDSDGREFRLGTGFTDHERRYPPQIGSLVTFSFNGVTNSGVPRFARFLRERLPE